MFANLVALITGRPPPELEHQAFVQEVRIHAPAQETSSPAVERLILVCWLLIAVKHVAVIWAVSRYQVPFHQLWVNFPTWLFGVLATGVYFLRERGGQRRGLP
jgi:hypothetical protein